MPPHSSKEEVAGRPPTATHTHALTGTQEIANLLQTAEAAYRLILVGAATTSARKLTIFFRLNPQKFMISGDTDTGT